MRIVTGLRIGLAVIIRALKGRTGKAARGRGGASAVAMPSTNTDTARLDPMRQSLYPDVYA